MHPLLRKFWIIQLPTKGKFYAEIIFLIILHPPSGSDLMLFFVDFLQKSMYIKQHLEAKIGIY